MIRNMTTAMPKLRLHETHILPSYRGRQGRSTSLALMNSLFFGVADLKFFDFASAAMPIEATEFLQLKSYALRTFSVWAPLGPHRYRTGRPKSGEVDDLPPCGTRSAPISFILEAHEIAR